MAFAKDRRPIKVNTVRKMRTLAVSRPSPRKWREGQDATDPDVIGTGGIGTALCHDATLP